MRIPKNKKNDLAQWNAMSVLNIAEMMFLLVDVTVFFASGEFFQILLLGCTSWYPFFFIGSFHPVNLKRPFRSFFSQKNSPKSAERDLWGWLWPLCGLQRWTMTGTHRRGNPRHKPPGENENAPTKCPIEQSAVYKKKTLGWTPLVPSRPFLGGKCELSKDFWEDQSPPNPRTSLVHPMTGMPPGSGSTGPSSEIWMTGKSWEI